MYIYNCMYNFMYLHVHVNSHCTIKTYACTDMLMRMLVTDSLLFLVFVGSVAFTC